MNDIKVKWDAMLFVVAQYRDTTDRFIVKEVEEVITQLEDDSLTISTMMGSKYVNEIRDEVEDWEKKLADRIKILQTGSNWTAEASFWAGKNKDKKFMGIRKLITEWKL